MQALCSSSSGQQFADCCSAELLLKDCGGQCTEELAQLMAGMSVPCDMYAAVCADCPMSALL